MRNDGGTRGLAPRAACPGVFLHPQRFDFMWVQKKNRTGRAPRLSGLHPMRLAQGWAWIRRRAIWSTILYQSVSDQVRVQSSSTRNARQTTATCDPPERSYKAVGQKNPSAATNKERLVSKNYCKHRLPQARCLFGSLLFRLPVAAEGRFERLLRQFRTINSNRTTTCQCLEGLYFKYFVPRPPAFV